MHVEGFRGSAQRLLEEGGEGEGLLGSTACLILVSATRTVQRCGRPAGRIGRAIHLPAHRGEQARKTERMHLERSQAHAQERDAGKIPDGCSQSSGGNCAVVGTAADSRAGLAGWLGKTPLLTLGSAKTFYRSVDDDEIAAAAGPFLGGRLQPE